MDSCHALTKEQYRALPGDSLIQEPIATWTHAITLTSPTANVWH